MPSHLTRSVFRALLADEPIVAKGCRRQSRSWPHHPNFSLRPRVGLQRRHLFGLSAGASENTRRQDYVRGKGKTLITSKIVGDLIAAQRQQFRPPPRKEVADVLRSFFQSLSEETPLTEYDTNFTNVALKYVRGEAIPGSKRQHDLDFSEADLRHLLLALTAGALKSTKIITEAKELGDAVLKDLLSDSSSHAEALDEAAVMQSDYFGTYLQLLAATGHARDAVRLISSFAGPEEQKRALWISLLRSTLQKRQERAFEDFIQAFLESGVHEEKEIIDLLRKVADLDFVQPTKSLHKFVSESGYDADHDTKTALLQFSIRNNETVFGQSIFDTVDVESEGELVSLHHLWSAARGVPPERIISALEEQLGRDDDSSIDLQVTATVNGLVQYAHSVKDVAAAEQYLGLITDCGLQPNAATYLLQLEHYIAVGNVDLAVQACDELHRQSLASENLSNALGSFQNEDAANVQYVRLLNRLIVAVCTTTNPRYDLIMDLLESLLEKTSNLEPATVAALIDLYLPRGEWLEIHDLMESHYPVFSGEERNVCRTVVVDYITNLDVDALQAWHAYDMFRNVFADTSIVTRGEIMKSFFKRKRSDLACLVFGHMRQSQDPKARPSADLYTECFKGIADCGDSRGAELVHNMLKLDIYVDPNTRLLNSLMLAWAYAGEAWRSLEIFTDILNTVEGPSYTTFAVMFRACEKFTPNGQSFAMQNMARIRSGGHKITREVYHAYLGAIAGNGDYTSALELIENMEKETGHPPDTTTLGIVYNALFWLNQSADFELWAKEKFPTEWYLLVNDVGYHTVPDTGEKVFAVDNRIEI